MIQPEKKEISDIVNCTMIRQTKQTEKLFIERAIYRMEIHRDKRSYNKSHDGTF